MSALPAPTLQSVLASGNIWRGDGVSLPPLPGLPSGFTALDAVLPGGGWPVGAISELFPEHEGIGEVSLLLPALSRLAQAGRAVAWVVPALRPGATRKRGLKHTQRPSPARIPCAPALAAAGLALDKLLLIEPPSAPDALWALRQIIASRAFGAVIGWLGAVDAHSLRRLQIAAEGSPTAVLLFRPVALAHQASPAALKLRLTPQRQGLAVCVIKRRGAPLEGPVVIPVKECMIAHSKSPRALNTP